MLLEQNQKVQSYRLHLFELIYTRSSGKLHLIFTPVDPISTPSKAHPALSSSCQRVATKAGQWVTAHLGCTYGGAAGIRTRVLSVVEFASTLQYIYNTLMLECQVLNLLS
jgi:hypothetical protein